MFQRTLRQTTWQMGRDTAAMRMTAPLQCSLITVKVVGLEEIPFSIRQNPKTVC